MKWKLVNDAIGEPEIIERDEEDLTLGFSLLRALAESDDTLVEISRGVWRATGPNPGSSGPGTWIPYRATDLGYSDPA